MPNVVVDVYPLLGRHDAPGVGSKRSPMSTTRFVDSSDIVSQESTTCTRKTSRDSRGESAPGSTGIATGAWCIWPAIVKLPVTVPGASIPGYETALRAQNRARELVSIRDTLPSLPLSARDIYTATRVARKEFATTTITNRPTARTRIARARYWISDPFGSVLSVLRSLPPGFLFHASASGENVQPETARTRFARTVILSPDTDGEMSIQTATRAIRAR